MIAPNDPRLTAFALGELQAGERDEFGDLLRRTPHARRELAEIRDLAELLEYAYANEDSRNEEALTTAQRKQIRTLWWLHAEPAGRRLPRALFAKLAIAAAMAASLIVIVVTLQLAGDPVAEPGAVVSIVDSARRAIGEPPAAPPVLDPRPRGAAAAPRTAVASRRHLPPPRAERPKQIDGPVAFQRGTAAIGPDSSAVGPAVSAAPSRGGGSAQRHTASVRGASWMTYGLSGTVTIGRIPPTPYDPFISPPHNPFERAAARPLSSFALHVGDGAFERLKAALAEGRVPAPREVRIEELVNRFTYPEAFNTALLNVPDTHAVGVATELAECPWRANHKLLSVTVAVRRPIAGDAQLRVEFNPLLVQAYRLIGYDDAPDLEDGAHRRLEGGQAASLPAGYGVTALYEIIPTGVPLPDYLGLATSRPEGNGGGAGPSANRIRDSRTGEGDAASRETAAGPTLPVRESPPVSPEEAAEIAALLDEWGVDGLKYQPLLARFGTDSRIARDVRNGGLRSDTPADERASVNATANELGTITVTYAPLEAVDESGVAAPIRGEAGRPALQIVAVPARARGSSLAEASDDFRFAAALASFGMLLRESPYLPGWTIDAARDLAVDGLGYDPSGARREALGLIDAAKRASSTAKGLSPGP